MDVEDEFHLKDLTISRNLRKTTIKEYARSLNQYCNFINKNPMELIEEAEVEEDNGIRMKNWEIKRYILDFKHDLLERNLRYNTIKKTLAVVKTFFS